VGHEHGQFDEPLDAAETFRDLKETQPRQNMACFLEPPFTSKKWIPLKNRLAGAVALSPFLLIDSRMLVHSQFAAKEIGPHMPPPSTGLSLDKLTRTRKARPERFSISLRGQSGGTPLPLPARSMWPVGLAIGVAFLIFAAIAWNQIGSLRGQKITTVFDLSIFLFQGFWVLGWSVGVLVLGALALLFLFYKESAWLRGGRLIHVPRLGPLHFTVEYDLAKIRNLRLEPARENAVRVRFDYGDGSNGLGDTMARADAEKLVTSIQEAASLLPRTRGDEAIGPILEPMESSEVRPDDLPTRKVEPIALTSFSSLSLIAANLLPVAGVLFLNWKLADIMVLYWAESAVIGFWNVIKLAMVGKWLAPLVIPFFVGHFGGFMAGHFLLIYYLFVRDIDAGGPEAGVWNALFDLFAPLQSALLGFFISHGVSFFSNFVGRREYIGTELKQQMIEPYKRIMVMHMTLIVGGFLTLILRTLQPALLLLIILKTAVDLRAHLREHDV
jgi:Family of unknown function (DUF6498)